MEVVQSDGGGRWIGSVSMLGKFAAKRFLLTSLPHFTKPIIRTSTYPSRAAQLARSNNTLSKHATVCLKM